MSKRRYNKNSLSVVQSVRMPFALKLRIIDLSKKNLITINEWIVKALEQKAYKHKNTRLDFDSGASGEE